MFVLVLAAEADETRQAITLLIVCLVGIAVMLAALTAWYWMFTSPKRRAGRLLTDLGHYEPSVDLGLNRLADEAVAAPAHGDEELAVVGAGSADTGGNIRIGNDASTGDEQAPPSDADRPSRASKLAAAAGPAILSDSSDLLSQTLAAPPASPAVEPPAAPAPAVKPPAARPAKAVPPARAIPAAAPASSPPFTPRRRAPQSVPPAAAAASTSVRNAAAPITVRGAKSDSAQRQSKANPPRSERPRSTRIEVADRSQQRRAADELAEARQRRARRERDESGLSDDDWAAVMKSAFNHLNR